MFSAERLRQIGQQSLHREGLNASREASANASFDFDSVPTPTRQQQRAHESFAEDYRQLLHPEAGNEGTPYDYRPSATTNLKVVERRRRREEEIAHAMNNSSTDAQWRPPQQQRPSRFDHSHHTSRIEEPIMPPPPPSHFTSPPSTREQPIPRPSAGSPSLAAWSRASLEARIKTLEQMLADNRPASDIAGGDYHFPRSATDAELSEHLQVTVRANRELRGELEVTKGQLANMIAEKERFVQNLEKNQAALTKSFEEAQRARDSLSESLARLVEEKSALQRRVTELEAENARLKSEIAAAAESPSKKNGGVNNDNSGFLVLDADTVTGSLQDVRIINEALKESLRRIKSHVRDEKN